MGSKKTTEPEEPTYFFDIKLPGFPGNKEYQKKEKEKQREFLAKIIFVKKTHPYSKRTCYKCFYALYEEDAKCPNCDDYGQREEKEN